MTSVLLSLTQVEDKIACAARSEQPVAAIIVEPIQAEGGRDIQLATSLSITLPTTQSPSFIAEHKASY